MEKFCSLPGVGTLGPPSATVHGGLAIAGYAVNKSSKTEAAALYGWCVSGGNNIRNCEGLNVLATGTENATGNRRIGIEADVGASANETVTAQYGVLVTGANRGNPPTQGSVGFALSPSAGTTNPWQIGFLTADGSVRTFAQAGAQCYTGSCGSQLLQLRSFYGGRGLYSYVGSSAAGDVQFTPSANRNVQLDVGMGKSVHVTSSTINKDLAGTCVFSSGTTCSITYANSFTSIPVVILTPVNPGSVKFTLTSTYAYGFTITASEPNSSTVNYIVLGNPN